MNALRHNNTSRRVHFSLRFGLWWWFLLFSTVCRGDDNNMENNNNNNTMETLPPLVTLRLWLIRHGETMANVENRVSGQAESALTLRGRQQAIALRSTLRPMVFWRRYASDLQRTRETSHLLLLPPSDQELFVWEERLRELSKGARQGYPKHYSEDQALQARIQQAQEQGREFQRNEVPLLETEEQAYQRFLSWMLDVAREAVMTQQQQDDESSTSTSPPTTTNNNVNHHVYPILVVSHSALLRVVLTRFFSKLELMQQGAIYDDKKAHNENHRLVIPNTSLTIVDILVHSAPTTTTTSNNYSFSMSISQNDDSKKQETPLISTTTTHPKTRQEEEETTTTLESSVYYWKPKLQQLTWTGHYAFLP
jgi:broad specificity phosphatase PhoE